MMMMMKKQFLRPLPVAAVKKVKEYHTLKAQIADENALKSAAQFDMHH